MNREGENHGSRRNTRGRPTPGLEEGTFDSSGVLSEGTLISASVVLYRGRYCYPVLRRVRCSAERSFPILSDPPSSLETVRDMKYELFNHPVLI